MKTELFRRGRAPPAKPTQAAKPPRPEFLCKARRSPLGLGGCCTNEIRALSAANKALGLLKSVDADRVFADAAEVEFAVVFDDIGDLAIAVRRAVLEVFDDAALRVEGDDE